MKLVAAIGLGVALGLGVWWLWGGAAVDPAATDEPQAATAALDGVLEPREPVRADGTFTVSTSFYPLQFALERIAGERATVVNIGAGQDPHDFRPSTQAMVQLQESDVVVLQGAFLEPWGEEVATQLKTAGIPVVLASDAVELHEAGHEHAHDTHHDEEHHDEAHHDEEHHDEEPHDESASNVAESSTSEDEHHETGAGEHADEPEGESTDEHRDEADHHSEDAHAGHEHGDYDPHTWLDPVLFSEQVAYLVDALSTLDPDFASEYEANGAALQAELTALDNQFAAALGSCRYDEAIVSHDLLGYVGDRYELDFHSIAGLSTQDMPSVSTLAELRAEAAAGVGAILLEENAIAAYGETLAQETGLQTITLNPVAYAIPAGEDYLTLQTANAAALAQAFGCNE